MGEVLAVRGLRAGYDGGTVLHDTDFSLPAGQVVALLGRNGVGKSTLCSAIMGLIRPYQGSIQVNGVELAGARADLIARAGVAIVPQGRRLFPALSVERNLTIAAPRTIAGGWTLDRVYTLLPRLAMRSEYRADQLSGGEQQMLAIGRALMQNPRVLLLDEPSEGLAPAMVDRMIDVVRSLRTQGLSILLVEQDLRAAFALADEVAVMQRGAIVHRSSTREFRGDAQRAHRLLGVT
ncbi:MAG: branched-chain amino acid transport system ATP-binding protein [Micromonosporaceae bacterium]